MVDPQIGRAGFRIACYVAVVSGAMLLFLRPGTPEFVVATFSLAAGLFFGTIIAALVWVAARTGRAGGASRFPPDEEP